MSKPPYATSFWWQYRVLVRRTSKCIFRDKVRPTRPPSSRIGRAARIGLGKIHILIVNHVSTEQRTLHCERGPLQSLTLSRFAAHVSVAILMSILYWNVGNNIDKSRDHVAALFFHVLIIMFAAMMPTVQTCALATFSNTLHTPFVRARLTPDR